MFCEKTTQLKNRSDENPNEYFIQQFPNCTVFEIEHDIDKSMYIHMSFNIPRTVVTNILENLKDTYDLYYANIGRAEYQFCDGDISMYIENGRFSTAIHTDSFNVLDDFLKEDEITTYNFLLLLKKWFK